MNWRDHIHSDPKILGGKPIVRETRLSVDFLLGLLGAGWTHEQVLANYPALNEESLQAVFVYAAEIQLARDDGRVGFPCGRLSATVC